MLKDYQDERGFLHRVRLIDPDDAPESGLHLSVDFGAIAEQAGLPDAIAIDMQSRLWRAGFVTPEDFSKGDVYPVAKQALERAVTKQSNVFVELIRGMNNNGN